MAAGRGPAAPGAGPGLGDARPDVPGPACRRPGRPVTCGRRRRRGRQRDIRPDAHDRGAGPSRHDPSRVARPGAAGEATAEPPARRPPRRRRAQGEQEDMRGNRWRAGSNPALRPFLNIKLYHIIILFYMSSTNIWTSSVDLFQF